MFLFSLQEIHSPAISSWIISRGSWKCQCSKKLVVSMTTTWFLSFSLSSFAPWISRLLRSLKCQPRYQYPPETQLHLLLPQIQTSALRVDLGAQVYINYYRLLMLRTLLSRPGILPNMPSLSPSISTHVVSNLCSQIFKISHYRKTSISLFSISLSVSLSSSLTLCTFHCLWFWTKFNAFVLDNT